MCRTLSLFEPAVERMVFFSGSRQFYVEAGCGLCLTSGAWMVGSCRGGLGKRSGSACRGEWIELRFRMYKGIG